MCQMRRKSIDNFIISHKNIRLTFGGHGHGVLLLNIATYSAACQRPVGVLLFPSE